mgnify:FL=1
MGFFIARQASISDRNDWAVARNVEYPTYPEAKNAIISDFGFWNWYFEKYRVADCDHYPDQGIWRKKRVPLQE